MFYAILCIQRVRFKLKISDILKFKKCNVNRINFNLLIVSSQIWVIQNAKAWVVVLKA